MSWASHPTTEMPTDPSLLIGGRHRARRRGALGLLLLVLLLVGAGLTVGPRLFDPSTAAAPALSASTAPGPSVGAEAGRSTVGNPTGSPSEASGPAVPMPDLEAEVFALTNAERAKLPCPPLRLDDRLAAAARAHSLAMATTGAFSHAGADGSDPGERMRRAGFDTTAGWAENIARGQSMAAAVLNAWMGSTDHRGNILDCALTALGVGAARAANGQLYWTQDFGGG